MRGDAGAGRGARLGAAEGIPAAEPGRHAAGADRERRAADRRRLGDRRISRRDARLRAERAAALAGQRRPARRGPAALRMVPVQVRGGGHRLPGRGEGVEAREGAARRQRRGARFLAAAGCAGQHPHPSSLCRASDLGEELACRRPDELCRSGGRRGALGRRLSGRGSMAGRLRREGLVHADEVAPGLPSAAGPTRCAGTSRRSTTPISTSDAARAPRADRGACAEEGFDAFGVTTPGRNSRSRRTAGAGDRRRPSRHHGLARRDSGATRQPGSALAGGPLHRHARDELRAGRAIRSRRLPTGRRRRSPSMRATATTTT